MAEADLKKLRAIYIEDPSNEGEQLWFSLLEDRSQILQCENDQIIV